MNDPKVVFYQNRSLLYITEKSKTWKSVKHKKKKADKSNLIYYNT